MVINIPVSIDEDALVETITKDAEKKMADEIAARVKDRLGKTWDRDPIGDMAVNTIRDTVNQRWDSLRGDVIKELANRLSRTKKAQEALQEALND